MENDKRTIIKQFYMILRVLCVSHFAHRFFYLLFNRTRDYFFGFKLHFSSLTFHMYINNTIMDHYIFFIIIVDNLKSYITDE